MDIRKLTQPDELVAAAAFQSDPAFDAQPIRFEQPALVVLAENGGLVLGAFDGAELVGVSISFLGTDISDPKRPAMANLKMVTPVLGERPDYREHDVAYRLLLAQRDFATRQGIRLITWMLDPLNSTYAHLSLHLLGAITDRYVTDFYGANGHPVGTTDRLMVDWWVTNRRVEERLAGRRGLLRLHHYLDGNAQIINPTQVVDGFPVPDQPQILSDANSLLLEIPVNMGVLADEAPELVQSWRQHVRNVLMTVLPAGFVITDFVTDEWEGRLRAFYALSRAPSGFFSPS